MDESFSRRQIERSFRKFNDTVSDLFLAKFQTWGNTFTHLITHCEQDSVMKVVTEERDANNFPPGVTSCRQPLSFGEVQHWDANPTGPFAIKP